MSQVPPHVLQKGRILPLWLTSPPPEHPGKEPQSSHDDCPPPPRLPAPRGPPCSPRNPSVAFPIDLTPAGDARPGVPRVPRSASLRKASQESGPAAPCFEEVLPGTGWTLRLGRHALSSHRGKPRLKRRQNRGLGRTTPGALMEHGTRPQDVVTPAPQDQAHIGNLIYFDQAKDIALKSLKNISPPKFEELFGNLTQGPSEWFPDFLSQVASKRVQPGPTLDSLVKQVAWEGAATET